MARKINRLNALKVKNLKEPGWYADGQGLYLQISKWGSKSWVYRYAVDGIEKKQGMGGFPSVSLDSARKLAAKCREQRAQGIDPLFHKQQQKAEQKLTKSKSTTFKECATSYIEANRAGWKNAKHAQQWANTLETYAYPFIGDIEPSRIDISHVLKVLEPIWYVKTETATRVRQRIEHVIDWEKAVNERAGENPARWRGNLNKLLPERNKVQKAIHFAAMPYKEAPKFFKRLRKIETVSAKALSFTILTATRSNESRQANWNEIDLEEKVWIIPPERMKADREHRVPLTDDALNILKEMEAIRTSDYVFPGLKFNSAISGAALRKTLQESYPTLTVHGFRSTFRDWCAEMTSYPESLAEAALAHVLKDKTAAAYQRGDLFAKRFKLMQGWEQYCKSGKVSADVVPIKKKSNVQG